MKHDLNVADLVADPKNRRSHDQRNVDMVSDSLRQVGAARSIVIDEDDVVLAGNGVTAAAAAAGITKVRVIEADGQEIIAVRRRGLTPEQKRALSLYDNRTAELSAWNYDQLQADKEAGLSLQPYWTEGEEAIMLGQAAPATWNGMPEFQQGDATAFCSLKIHFANQADVDAFAKLIGQLVTKETRYIWYPPTPNDAGAVQQYASPDEAD